MFEKPEDREVICRNMAWDFYDGKVLTVVQLKVIIIEGDKLLRRLQYTPSLPVHKKPSLS